MFVGKWNKDEEDDIIYKDPCQIFKDGEFRVWFFGTLYNKEELKYESLMNDAEVIASIYRKNGYEGFAVLDGSFTCIIRCPGMTIIGRDHHGTSSQVYYTDKYFASSLAQLQETKEVSLIPDYHALSMFLSVGYVATPSSAFQNVYKLGAGEVLIWKNNVLKRISLFPVDEILPASKEKSLDEYAGEYARLHAEAIRKRIGMSSNVGILLSGGYDSGCNLAALRQIYDGEIRSYSIGFKGDNWTELPLARCMSDTFHTRHSEYEIDGSEIDALPQIVEYLGDPFVEGGLMVNYSVMRLIGDDKPDVILGGDGSDQYFGTSGREVALHYLMSKYGIRPFAGLIYNLLSHNLFDKNNSFYRIRFHLDKILHILQGDLFGFPSFLLKEMLVDQSLVSIPDIISPDTRSFEQLYIQHTYKSDIEKIINQVILFKASKMSDMFGNNLAFPYMDLNLYKFLLQLPVCYKCKGNTPTDIAKGHFVAKYLLKYHYKPILPDAITSKKKQGGFAPMPIFFKDDKRRARIADFILNSSVIGSFLKKEAVEHFIKQYDKEVHEDGNWFWYKQNRAIQYFNLLTLAIWWDRFVEQKQISLI
ncbi:asparagine synthetase B family protein [Parabacteroides bouchesdurhonensis]|uniref:asparagine synthase-related protein n=1 Tax=Parabacteroides bouchesdurhonensis TaxID=1936995 RepID=UPI000C8311C2|nr:asparagine synthetase B family protein [Parabacteroides bouchesdurhonensis]